MWPILGISFVIILGYFTVLWIVSLALKDASIVDVFWGFGFVVAAVIYFVLTDGYLGRKILLLAMVALWGLRLSGYILARNWGTPEDRRYTAMREKRGRSFWWASLFRVFLLQGVLLFLVSAPLFAAQYYAGASSFVAWDFIGLGVWAVGLFFEALGDSQLARFKADPTNRGKVMNKGLWRYTRHPNYFGEVTLWWGYYLVAVAAGGWWAFYGSLLMTFLILRVSGVTLLEKNLGKTKPKYREYIKATSAFIPWFPRKPKTRREA